VVVDAQGTIRAQVRRPTAAGAEGVLGTATAVVEALRTAVPEAGSTPVGVGIPGLVDAGEGAVKHAVNLGVDGEWLHVSRLLAEKIGVPVLVENDVNAATLGAVAITGEDDLVYLSIGTGLAAGLVLDGRLRRGVDWAAGEIGHVPVDPAGRPCTCGQRGRLETVASGSALAAAWPSDDLPPAQAVFAAAARGDEHAIAVRDRFADGVAGAVRVLCLAVDPRTVVLGGGVSHLGDQLLVSVSEALLRQAVGSPFLASLDLDARVRIIPTDQPVAAVGAALLGRSADPGR
jgi:predicted NBD/HSP70 family sugar kinase